mgnify:CR=1 FL=1
MKIWIKIVMACITNENSSGYEWKWPWILFNERNIEFRIKKGQIEWIGANCNENELKLLT